MSQARASALPTEPEALEAAAAADPLTSPATRRQRKAFERLYATHHQELYRYCFSILRRREDAEDALQATMAAALRTLPGEQREIALRPWLFRVAHNESITLLRKRRPTAAVEEIADPADSAAEEIDGRDRLRTLVADLRSLPERQSSAMVMRELSGLSYEEIGEALSCSGAASRQSVYEARTALRTLEEGREMECAEVRRTISDRDGRRLRGRKIKAHIDSCDGCRGFAASIEQRKGDLRVLCPPLPAFAATAMLSGLLGGGGGAGAGAAGGAAGIAGGAGGFAGAGLAGSAAIKGASVLAAVVLAAGAADAGGVIDLPLPGGLGGGDEPAASPSSSEDSAAPGSDATSSPASGPALSRDGAAGSRNGNGAPGVPGKAGEKPGHSGAAPGKSESAPGQSGSEPGQSGSSNGKSEEAPGQTGSSPGRSEEAPGHSGSSPGNSAAAPGHSSSSPGNSAAAPGHSGSSPGNSASAPGHSSSSPGNSGSAPGQSGSSPGNSGSAPGHSGSSPGNSASAPGQSGTAPPESPPGQSAAPPGKPETPPGQSAAPPGQSNGNGNGGPKGGRVLGLIDLPPLG